MPTETQTRDLLHRTADELEIGPPPIDSLLASPGRRRRNLTVAAAGLAAAAVIVAVAVVDDSDSSSPAREVTPVAPPTNGTTPTTSSPGPVEFGPARIISAEGTCGATDGFALDVLVESDERLSMYVLMLVGDRIVGKQPEILRPGRQTHIVVDLIRAPGPRA